MDRLRIDKIRNHYRSLSLESFCVHIFYLILFYYTFTRSVHIFGYWHFPEPTFVHFIIRWIPKNYFPDLIPLCVGIYLGLTIFLALYPWILITRVIHFLLHLIFFAYISSFGHDANDYYVITFILPLFFLLKSSDQKERTSLVLHLAQFGSVMSYAMAGIYKVKAIPVHGLDQLMGNLGNVIAFEHFQRGHEMAEISKFFIENDQITGVMFIGTILVQVLSPIGVAFKRTQIFTGLMLCLFHYLSEIIVHISFRPQMAAVALLLVVLPLLRSYQERTS